MLLREKDKKKYYHWLVPTCTIRSDQHREDSYFEERVWHKNFYIFLSLYLIVTRDSYPLPSNSFNNSFHLCSFHQKSTFFPPVVNCLWFSSSSFSVHSFHMNLLTSFDFLHAFWLDSRLSFSFSLLSDACCPSLLLHLFKDQESGGRSTHSHEHITHTAYTSEKRQNSEDKQTLVC